MFRLFPSVFTVEDVRKIREFLAQIEFVDGANTAGSWVGGKKHNLEASIQATADLGQQIIKVVTQHRGIAAWSVPTRAARPLFNCYREGDYYHRHEDNPVVSDIRADVSYTVFLTEPEEYEGGALVLRVGDETRSFKEPAGSVLVYDSGTPHEVQLVARGERFAAAGWLQSGIRDPQRRRLLYQFRECVDTLWYRQGPCDEVDTLTAIMSTLTRECYEP